MNAKRCPGFAEDGSAFDCDGTPGTPWTPVWCPECDERRRARLTIQFKQLATDAWRAATGEPEPG